MRAAIIAGGRRRAPGSTFHENFSCYRSLSWSRGYARGGCSLASLSGGGGTSASSAWRGNGVRDAIAKRQRNSHSGTRKANVRVREGERGTEGVRQKEGETRIPRQEGIRKKEREWEGTGARERRAKETKEKETGIDSAPRYEARGNAMRRVEPRRLVPELAWQGLYQRRCCRIVGHQWQLGIRRSHQPRWQRRVTTALGTVRL